MNKFYKRQGMYFNVFDIFEIFVTKMKERLFSSKRRELLKLFSRKNIGNNFVDD